MMPKGKLLMTITIIGIVSLILVGCEGSSDFFSNDGTGELQMLLTDAPVDEVDEVNIWVERVEINNSEDGWQVFTDYSDNPKQFDLLSLQGITDVLGEETLPVGTYEQIRLYLSDVEVVKDGESLSVRIPSADQTGLKLTNEFTIEENEVKALLLDFDARKSLVKPGSNQGFETEYIMRPTIRVVDRVLSGDVEGMLTSENISDFSSYLIKVYANSTDDEEVTSTIADADGSFKLLGLEEGEYTAKVYDQSENEVASKTLTVTAKETTQFEINLTQ